MKKNKERDDGGPAFPYGADEYSGMSLRDWFAGQAMIALGPPDEHTGMEGQAEYAYALADFMIAERQK